MDDARDAIIAGKADHGDLFSAGFQESGRGRIAGRKWDAALNENALMTFILSPGRIGSGFPLPLLAGWGLSEFLQVYAGIETRIKWPNDLIAGENKISGILCESCRSFFLAGIGMNVNQTEFPGEYRRPVSSLKLLTGRGWDTQKLISDFSIFLIDFLSKPPELSLFNQKLYKKGEQVSVLLGDPKSDDRVSGILQGIKPDGALLVKTEKGDFYPVYSGEIVFK